MAANSFNHSSSTTAHNAKSRVRLLFGEPTVDEELEIASSDVKLVLSSFDMESIETLADDDVISRSV